MPDTPAIPKFEIISATDEIPKVPVTEIFKTISEFDSITYEAFMIVSRIEKPTMY